MSNSAIKSSLQIEKNVLLCYKEVNFKSKKLFQKRFFRKNYFLLFHEKYKITIIVVKESDKIGAFRYSTWYINILSFIISTILFFNINIFKSNFNF